MKTWSDNRSSTENTSETWIDYQGATKRFLEWCTELWSSTKIIFEPHDNWFFTESLSEACTDDHWFVTTETYPSSPESVVSRKYFENIYSTNHSWIYRFYVIGTIGNWSTRSSLRWLSCYEDFIFAALVLYIFHTLNYKNIYLNHALSLTPHSNPPPEGGHHKKKYRANPKTGRKSTLTKRASKATIGIFLALAQTRGGNLCPIAICWPDSKRAITFWEKGSNTGWRVQQPFLELFKGGSDRPPQKH